MAVLATISAHAFADVLYWTSARASTGNHQIHLFDGPNPVASVDQIPAAQGSAWGYRDGATDRAGHMYFGWEGGVARHDLNGSNGTQIIYGACPGGVGTWRAMAFDPTLDLGAGGFWVANFGSNIAATEMDGSLIKTLPWDGAWSLHGLAYDDATGDLWGHDWYGTIIKIDTDTGVAILICPTSAFTPPFGTGLSGMHDGTGRIGAAGGTNQAGVYDGCNMVLGPWSLPVMPLGIAMGPEPAALSLLGLGAVTLLRRGR